MTDNYEKYHKQFQERMKRSERARWLVARWMVSLGKTVCIGPMTIAEKHADWRQHADNGDLWVDNQRIEVKHTRYEFTKKWPYKKFAFMATHRYDAADPKPYGIFQLNKDMTWAAFIKSDTFDQWKIGNFGDRDRPDYKGNDSYYCDRSLVKYYEIKIKR